VDAADHQRPQPRFASSHIRQVKRASTNRFRVGSLEVSALADRRRNPDQPTLKIRTKSGSEGLISGKQQKNPKDQSSHNHSC
jgi:hypothetical protein